MFTTTLTNIVLNSFGKAFNAQPVKVAEPAKPTTLQLAQNGIIWAWWNRGAAFSPMHHMHNLNKKVAWLVYNMTEVEFSAWMNARQTLSNEARYDAITALCSIVKIAPRLAEIDQNYAKYLA